MENQEVQNNSAHSIKWGVILGVVGIIITLLLYLVDVTLLAKGWVGIVSLVITLGLTIYAGLDYRKLLGGFMSFGQAFMHAFVTLAIAGLLGVIFQYLLFNVIDPEAAKTIADIQLENNMQMMESLGANDTETMDRMAEQTQNTYKLSTLAMGYGFLLILYAILGAIIGLITKKKNKELDF